MKLNNYIHKQNLFGFLTIKKIKYNLMIVCSVHHVNLSLQCVRRFIYGNRADFKEFEIAFEVYKFAVLWQIKNLDDIAAASCFKLSMNAQNLLDLYQIFKLHEQHQNLMNAIQKVGNLFIILLFFLRNV